MALRAVRGAIQVERDEREQVLAAARTHRRDWVEGYRGELGFVTAVLHDTRSG